MRASFPGRFLKLAYEKPKSVFDEYEDDTAAVAKIRKHCTTCILTNNFMLAFL